MILETSEIALFYSTPGMGEKSDNTGYEYFERHNEEDGNSIGKKFAIQIEKHLPVFLPYPVGWE